MANCREIEDKLAEYVDGLQADAERAAVDSHLEACPRCRARAAGERAVHDLVCARRDSLRRPAPGSLRQRCAAQRRLASPPAPPLARAPWVRFSLAASVLVAAGLFVLFGLGSSVETYAAQLSVDHLKCFQYPPEASPPPDVTLLGKTWQAQSGWGLKVNSSLMEGLTLLGIRKCGSSRGRVAHIFYRWHGEPLSVYVLNHRFDHSPTASHDHDVTRFGEHAIVWTEHERTYAVVADSQLPELQRVAAYVRRSIE
jgi:anti-sigma factor RsiW